MSNLLGAAEVYMSRVPTPADKQQWCVQNYIDTPGYPKTPSTGWVATTPGWVQKSCFLLGYTVCLKNC